MDQIKAFDMAFVVDLIVADFSPFSTEVLCSFAPDFLNNGIKKSLVPWFPS